MKLTNLKTKFLGKNNLYYDKIDSTQKEIWRLYEKDTPNGTLIMAGIQENGIGTHGRIWHTDQDNNIAFSFLIKTQCNINKLDGLTLRIAGIIVDIFKEKYGINLNIKKPNDIVYNKKKIGGILTETRITNEIAKAIVVGIGINTSQKDFSEDIKETASSIKKEFNIDIDVKKFIEEFCNRFENEILERIGNK
ncbi:MAG: biotin--[acetyl-CoA-carboxylase] ligase [Clostridia bacterium]|nr:biotin--[acetyl-CoA-carboxylase] ligase [Clostridia bacterium]